MKCYKVLIADDEPMAIQMIMKIIEKKCPDFKVVATAENGMEVLNKLEKESIDVVVTDIMMPGMNGITLVSKIRENYPLIYTVIVSGYQDFDYAKGALQAGVEDYVLKPVNPTEMQALFNNLKKKLDKTYFEKRIRFLHYLSQGVDAIDQTQLKLLFPSSAYYSAIIRKNSVLPRFNTGFSSDVFSSEQEHMLIYGRDDMEMLYLCSEEMMLDSFEHIMSREFEKHKEAKTFLTMVQNPAPFTVEEMPGVIRDLFKTLDHSIVIGKEQVITLRRGNIAKKNTENSDAQFDRILYLIQKKDVFAVTNELYLLFRAWQEEDCTQFWIEGKLRYLLYEMRNQNLLIQWNEYWLDDVFTLSSSMDDVCLNVQDIIRQYADYESSSNKNEKEVVFTHAVNYMKNHLSEDLSVQKVCQELGVSQAVLNRLFRTYSENSYKNYLTMLRIEKAKDIMSRNPDIFIKDVAEYVGFNDQFYFSRVFRSIVGVSPSEYAEKNRGELL